MSTPEKMPWEMSDDELSEALKRPRRHIRVNSHGLSMAQAAEALRKKKRNRAVGQLAISVGLTYAMYKIIERICR